MRRIPKTYIILASAILGFAAVLGVIFALDKVMGGSFSWNDKVHHKSYELNGETYNYQSCVNILFMGVDNVGEEFEGPSYNNTEQVDFLCILSINRSTKKYNLIQINRDTMVDVIKLGVNGKEYGTAYEQIALSHNEGNGGEASSKNVVKTLEKFLEIVNIDYYVTLKMDAVEVLVDYFGGVDVTLAEDQDLTPVHETWTPGSTIHLNGTEALEFIRARGEVEDGTNIKRMRRQREFIKKFFEKISNDSDFDNDYLYDGYKKAESKMLTDIGLYALNDMIEYIRSYEFGGIKLIEGTSSVNEKTNYIEIRVDHDYLINFVLDNFYEKAD